jgi:hypothetical protein
MEILNSIITFFMKRRYSQIEFFMKNPLDTQQYWLTNLVNSAEDTEWGRRFDYKSIHNERAFKERIPVSSYEELYPYIERCMKGEQNILWPSEMKMFSKSSGTTNAKSKFIPVSSESLEECHYKGGKDMMCLYVHNRPRTNLFAGKGLSIGGSLQPNHFNPDSDSYCGDVSALIMKNLPFWAEIIRTPELKIALMDKWEEKIEKMAHSTMKENVSSIQGVPTWTIFLIKRILEISGKQNILEVWPNLEVFVHGAVAFGPYKDLFKTLIPSKKMRYMEVYTASEGFFGIQDRLHSDDMLLMLDYGIYYEFMPLDELGKEFPKTLSLEEVEINTPYALIISTNAGLWRYLIGDTVKFTCLKPFRIKITGRTKHFINAFGEELMVENAEVAIAHAAHKTHSIIANFTAGPKFIGDQNKGTHEWIVEFEKEPQQISLFIELLDNKLKELNSDYEAKRSSDIALELPILHAVPKGTFYLWMDRRGKLGGQNKVPRLANDREYVDSILEMIYS